MSLAKQRTTRDPQPQIRTKNHAQPALCAQGSFVDPRAAVAVAVVPIIVTVTRFDILVPWIGASTWPMTVAICLATLAVLNHFRGEGRQT